MTNGTDTFQFLNLLLLYAYLVICCRIPMVGKREPLKIVSVIDDATRLLLFKSAWLIFVKTHLTKLIYRPDL